MCNTFCLFLLYVLRCDVKIESTRCNSVRKIGQRNGGNGWDNQHHSDACYLQGEWDYYAVILMKQHFWLDLIGF